MLDIVFVDFESSGRERAYPIEIGWARLTNGVITTDSRLITPAPAWKARLEWEEEAVGVHGLTMPRLESFGVPAAEALEAFQKAVGQSWIVFDTGEHGRDREWLDLLTDTVGAPGLDRQVGPKSSDTFLLEHAIKKGFVGQTWGLVCDQAPAMEHNAASDALHWAWIQAAIERISDAGLGRHDGSEENEERVLQLLQSIELPKLPKDEEREYYRRYPPITSMGMTF